MTTFTTKGIEYGWTVGENGWGPGMNLNLERLSAMAFGPFSIGPDGVSGLDVDVAGGLWWNASTETWDTVADATLTLTNAATNYVEVSVAGVISANTTGFTYGARPVAVVVTAGGAVTTITDRRTYGGDEPVAPGRLMGRDRSGTVSLKTGLDAVGSNTAAVDFVVDAPRSTGNATPALYKVRVAQQGSSGAALQTLADGWQVGEFANASTREIVAWNVSGPVMGGLPSNVATSMFANGDSGRFATRIRVIRAGGSAAGFVGHAIGGSFSAPTQALNNYSLVSMIGNARTDTGTDVTPATFQASLRENATASAFGSQWSWFVVNVGASTLMEVMRLRSGGSTTAEWLSTQATWRFIPATSGSFAWRTAANSADTMTLNEAGTTWTLPLATAAVIGTDPGGSELFRVGGYGRFTNVSLSSGGGQIHRAITTGNLRVSGGNGGDVGGNIAVYGQSHASQANDIELRSGSGVRGWWDDSAALWEFSNAASTLTRFATPAAGETALYVYDADNATLERVTVGAADSGGTGYKVLRIPN